MRITNENKGGLLRDSKTTIYDKAFEMLNG